MAASQLKELLNKAAEELRDKDKLIEKYQLEIRQRNDEIEKKMSVHFKSAPIRTTSSYS